MVLEKSLNLILTNGQEPYSDPRNTRNARYSGYMCSEDDDDVGDCDVMQITKMELQQQQQQLITMEGFDGSTVRVLVSRLINVVLALLAVILVFVHTGIHLLGPFLNTRYAAVPVTLSITSLCSQ